LPFPGKFLNDLIEEIQLIQPSRTDNPSTTSAFNTEADYYTNEYVKRVENDIMESAKLDRAFQAILEPTNQDVRNRFWAQQLFDDEVLLPTIEEEGIVLSSGKPSIVEEPNLGELTGVESQHIQNIKKRVEEVTKSALNDEYLLSEADSHVSFDENESETPKYQLSDWEIQHIAKIEQLASEMNAELNTKRVEIQQDLSLDRSFVENESETPKYQLSDWEIQHIAKIQAMAIESEAAQLSNVQLKKEKALSLSSSVTTNVDSNVSFDENESETPKYQLSDWEIQHIAKIEQLASEMETDQYKQVEIQKDLNLESEAAQLREEKALSLESSNTSEADSHVSFDENESETPKDQLSDWEIQHLEPEAAQLANAQLKEEKALSLSSSVTSNADSNVSFVENESETPKYQLSDWEIQHIAKIEQLASEMETDKYKQVEIQQALSLESEAAQLREEKALSLESSKTSEADSHVSFEKSSTINQVKLETRASSGHSSATSEADQITGGNSFEEEYAKTPEIPPLTDAEVKIQELTVQNLPFSKICQPVTNKSTEEKQLETRASFDHKSFEDRSPSMETSGADEINSDIITGDSFEEEGLLDDYYQKPSPTLTDAELDHISKVQALAEKLDAQSLPVVNKYTEETASPDYYQKPSPTLTDAEIQHISKVQALADQFDSQQAASIPSSKTSEVDSQISFELDKQTTTRGKLFIYL
jgi:hypothetical protein